MTNIDRFHAWRQPIIDKMKAEGDDCFLGLPDAWFENPHWGCENGHVSKRYLKSEEKGGVCLACHKPVYLIPKDVTEEELTAIVGGE